MALLGDELTSLYGGGQAHQILSQAGLHQGDPLASSLFDVALHPTLIRVAKEVIGVFLGGFEDNIHIMGRLSDALRALDLFARGPQPRAQPARDLVLCTGVAASGIGCSSGPAGVSYLRG